MKRRGILFLAARNLAQRPYRNGIVALCVAAVTGMLVSAELVDRSSRRGLELGLERLGADLVAVPRGLEGSVMRSYMTGEAAVFYMDASVEKKILSFPWVEKISPQLYIKSLSGASCCTAWDVFLIGFDPATDFTVKPWLSGNGNAEIGPDDIVVGAALGLDRGDEVMFYGRRFKVAGVLDATGSGLDMSVFMPVKTAYLMAAESRTKAKKALEIDNHTISAVLIKLKPENRGGIPPWKAAYELEQSIGEISVIQREDIAENVHENLSATLRTLHSASYAMWPLTALLIGLVFALAVNERRRDIGLLRAVGATRFFIARLVVAEAIAVAGIGAIAGLSAAIGIITGFSGLIARKMETPFYLPGAGEIAMIACVAFSAAILTGALSSIFPAIQSSGMEPYEAMRREE